MRKGSKRRTKSGRRRSTFQKTPSAGKIRYRTRTRTKIKYYSRPGRRVRPRYRRAIRGRSARARTGRIIGAAIAGVVAGAALGSLANEGGLLAYAPTQNKTGIAASGWVGLTLVILGFFVKSEGMKLLLYGLGGGLIVEEVTRQLETRGYDFRVAFAGAPALDYAHGMAGACAQLRSYEAANLAAQLPPSPSAQLPTASNSPPPAKASNKAPAAGGGGAPALDINRLNEKDLEDIKFYLLNGASFEDAVKQVLASKPQSAGVGLDPSAQYRFALRKVA